MTNKELCRLFISAGLSKRAALKVTLNNPKWWCDQVEFCMRNYLAYRVATSEPLIRC